MGGAQSGRYGWHICNNHVGHLAGAMSLFKYMYFKQMGHVSLFCQESTVISQQQLSPKTSL